MKTVGFIGLGTMGGPMARNVLKKGFPVRGFDLSPAALDKHREAGGTTAGSPREAAEGVDVLVTMLPDGPDVENAMLGKDGAIHGLKAGAIVIDMSTIHPAYTKKIGKALAERGVAMVDSPVGKTADHAIAGTLTLIVGGDAKVVEEVRPVLDCMGTDFFYCGELGMGEAMKLANNFLANTILSATSEALVMGIKAGLSLETMMSVMKTTMAWNNQLGISLPKKALADDFSLGFMVRLAEKDHRLAVELAKSLGVETPVGSAAFDVLKQASGNGLAGLDVSAVLRLREEQAGVKVRLAQ
ncbi:MAG: NAD(P)-dependent oxidoreductase [Rhizobiaceae bacterium]|jgi:4-hydroxybutyrate dehydrogenase/sulfolactaldehyde 3-reductase